MNVLHAAMAKCEPNIARWVMSHHPALLRLTDDTFDTPYITLLKTTADKLLHFEKHRSIGLFYALAKCFEILMSRYHPPPSACPPRRDSACAPCPSRCPGPDAVLDGLLS